MLYGQPKQLILAGPDDHLMCIAPPDYISTAEVGREKDPSFRMRDMLLQMLSLLCPISTHACSAKSSMHAYGGDQKE